MYKIQDINLTPIIGNDSIIDMYYRVNNEGPIANYSDGVIEIKKNSFIDAFTYFNSLSVEKWLKYTFAQKFYIVMEAKGKFEITLFGHYIENKITKKEILGRYGFDLKERERIVIPYPDYFLSQVVAFSLSVVKKTIIFDAYYSADLEKECFNNPYISLVTTTFKKEQYVKRNIDLLRGELFASEEFKNRFTWHIIDNGKTLKEEKIDNIFVVHNNNVGGAGGFARGMIESLRLEKKPSHILLMDDDVIMSEESLKRLYRFLNIQRDEYKDYFFSGAMLNMEAPNIQHENTAYISDDGKVYSVNTGMDMCLWESIIINEQIDLTEKKKHAAWWFCCIPTTVAKMDNLPLPIFVRGDDLEYSIRNHVSIITLNGIAIWHQGFAGKANPLIDYYQSRRNELVIRAIRPELESVDTMGFIEELFWQELYKFNYYGATLLVDAIEDFLKGPQWIFSADLFQEMQNRKSNKYETKNITDDIRSLIDYSVLYNNRTISKIKKFIYDYTYNGQARIPNCFIKRKTGVIPYGSGYYPSNQLLTTENIAVDVVNDKYIIYKKDCSEFRIIKQRFLDVKIQYMNQIDEIIKEYQAYENKITTYEFWKDYLDI